MGGQNKAPAPDAENGKLDNNKRLAFLEAGVSSLAVALAAAGIELNPDQDPIAQATAVVERWRELTLGVAELTVAVAAAKGVEPTSIENVFAEAVDGIACATARGEILNRIGAHLVEKYPAIVEAGGTIADQVLEALAADPPPPAPLEPDAANAKIAELTKEIEDLKAELADAAAAPKEKGAKAKAKSVRSRKCGPIDRDGALLAELCGEGNGPLEIVISDGRNEITDFAPYEVSAANFYKNSLGYSLTAPLHVRGGQSVVTIRGFGLFKDGKQVAFCAHPELVVRPGENRAFTKAVFF